MTDVTETIGGVRVRLCGLDGPLLDGDRAASDLIGGALSDDARIVVVPMERLAPTFLTLSTRVAGDAIQKFVNYGLQVVILGDISEAVAASNALRDFVRESNRGRHVWFLGDRAALEAKLSTQA